MSTFLNASDASVHVASVCMPLAQVDVAAMQAAAHLLLGTHNFTALADSRRAPGK